MQLREVGKLVAYLWKMRWLPKSDKNKIHYFSPRTKKATNHPNRIQEKRTKKSESPKTLSLLLLEKKSVFNDDEEKNNNRGHCDDMDFGNEVVTLWKMCVFGVS